MKKSLTLIGLSVVVLSTVVPSGVAYAHFPVEDAKTGLYASFHITPDHDPIAGKQSTITYDFGGSEQSATDYTFLLTIKPIKDESTQVAIDVDAEVVSAHYTFPTRGFYTVNLHAIPKNGGEASDLLYSQRVSRGIPQKTDSFNGFEVGVIAAVLGLSLTVVVLTLKDGSIERHKRTKGYS